MSIFASMNALFIQIRYLEKLKDTKEIIRIRISKKNIQHNGQRDKQLSTNHTCKTKNRVTRAPLKTGGELRCSGRESRFCSTSDTRHVNLATNAVVS